MLWKLSQRTFNGGQLDARLMGRTDLAKYYEGASILKNFIVKRQGCIVKRRGTVQIANFTQATGCVAITDYRLFPFTFENDYGYIVALIDDSNNGTRCCIFAKDGTIKATLTSVPYIGKDFAQISFDQSGDMLYLAHQAYPFARITRYGDTDWRYEIINFELCGHTSLPATPTISNCQLLPDSAWSASTGPLKTIYYIATAVKDGVESRPSEPYQVQYHTPWPGDPEGSIKISIATQNPAPDYYNIYKKDNAYTGLIGTTSTGLSVSGQDFVRVTPAESGKTQMPQNWGISNSPNITLFKTSEVNDSSYQGINLGGGSYTATFGTAQPIDSFAIALGYVQYIGSYGSNSNANAYIQFLPCLGASAIATVTFDDNSQQVKDPVLVPDNARSTNIKDNSIWGNPYASSMSAAISTKKVQRAQNCKLEWGITNRGSKLVKRIDIVFYSDVNHTSQAGGSFSYNGGNSSRWTSWSGTPCAVSGFWAKKNTTATVNEYVDDYITADASLTPPKYDQHFEDTMKYPGCVALYQQRLALARTVEQPFTFWLSCIGDLYNFNVHDSLREDDAMEMTLPATKYPDINHMILNRDLIMFCDSGEWIVAPSSGSALTYKTISSKVQSQIGCSKKIKPISVNDDVIFANMTAETLVATKYSYATDGYEATDLSVLSQDIFRGNAITSLAYKQHPDSILVATLEDGTFATLEYMKEHEVVAWSHHELAGGLKARYCCADGSVTDGTTDVYILAEDESVVGSRQFYLLRVKEDAHLTTVYNSVSMDQMTMTDAAGDVPTGFVAVNTLTGEVTEEGGTRVAGTPYVQGRPFKATFVSVKPEPNPNETVQFEIKNPTEVEIRVNEGSTLKVGQYGLSEDKDRTVQLDPTVTAATGAIQLKTADKTTLITGANNRDGRIRLTSDSVWPLTILSMSTTYQIEQANQEPQKVKGGEDAD